MIKMLHSASINFKQDFAEILNRGRLDIGSVTQKVQDLLDDILLHKEEAVFEHIKRFDGWNPTSIDEIKVLPQECQKAYENLNVDIKNALHIAYERIYAFHSKQKSKSWIEFEENGNILGQKVTPLDRAGLYIPGGKAAYPSSLLMNAIPAIVAGVKEIVVCTPTPQNQINELLLAALHLCQISEIYKVGGASAIGLLAYGSDTIRKVDVITGPGNIFVATAKKIVFGEVGIDMIAGPSEIAIIADEEANPEYIAYDLLSQAEHDEMASSFLLTPSEKLANRVIFYLERIAASLKRKDTVYASIKNRGAIIVAESIDECVSLSNILAPEHLEVLTRNPFEILSYIKHAGAIFLGENTPEPIGDYLAGPNHTLPTGGSAKFFSPLGTQHFMKKSSIVSFSKRAIMDLGKECAMLADIEGLDAHKKAVLARMNELNTKEL